MAEMRELMPYSEDVIKLLLKYDVPDDTKYKRKS